MGAFLLSHLRGTNVKLINEKNSLHITVWMPVNPSKLILPLIFLRTSYNSYICFGVAQACSKVWVVWRWSLRDRDLSYICLGAASPLVLETFKFKNFENGFQLPTMMGVQSNISLSSCLYWYATLKSCK